MELIQLLHGFHDRIQTLQSKIDFLEAGGDDEIQEVEPAQVSQAKRMPMVSFGRADMDNIPDRIKQQKFRETFIREYTNFNATNQTDTWNSVNTTNLINVCDRIQDIGNDIPVDITKLKKEERIKTELIKTLKNTRKTFIDHYNTVWEAVYDFNIDFTYCLHDKNNITPIDIAQRLDEDLKHYFQNRLYTIWDVFSGCGSDLMAWAQIDGVKCIYTVSTPVEAPVLKRNVDVLKTYFKENVSNKTLPTIKIDEEKNADALAIRQIDWIPPELPKNLDIAYMAPPWSKYNAYIYEKKQYNFRTALSKKDGTPEEKEEFRKQIEEEKKASEASPVAIVEFIAKVLQPVFDKEIFPKVIIIKGRWDNKHMRTIANILPKYFLFKSIACTPNMHTFYFHIFIIKQCHLEEMETGNIYNRIFYKNLNDPKNFHGKYPNPGQTNERNSDLPYVVDKGTIDYKEFWHEQT